MKSIAFNEKYFFKYRSTRTSPDQMSLIVVLNRLKVGVCFSYFASHTGWLYALLIFQKHLFLILRLGFCLHATSLSIV